MEGHRRWFPDTRLTFQVRKVIGGGGVVVGGVIVACRIIVTAPVQSLSSGLWILDFEFGFETWIWD